MRSNTHGNNRNNDINSHQNELTPLNGSLPLEFDDIRSFPRRQRDDTNDSRRWSVLEKLDRRHYCGICQSRSCYDCSRILSFKCMLATGMLIAFVILFFSLPHLFLSLPTTPSIADRYDFIVVGAGAAGSVISSLLVRKGYKVLLLEAGGSMEYTVDGTPDDSSFTWFDVPLMWASLSRFDAYRWVGFSIGSGGSSSHADNITEAKAKYHGTIAQDIIVGRGIGGSEMLSSMIYLRALPQDISSWLIGSDSSENGYSQANGQNASKQDIAVLDFEHIWQAYIDLESYEGLEPSVNNIHGSMGPIATSRPQLQDKLAPRFIEAAEKVGLSIIEDFNDYCGKNFDVKPKDSSIPTTLGLNLNTSSAFDHCVGRKGVGYYDFTIGLGTRSSASTSMLKIAIEQYSNQGPNSLLTVALGATVSNLLLSPVRSSPTLKRRLNEGGGDETDIMQNSSPKVKLSGSGNKKNGGGGSAHNGGKSSAPAIDDVVLKVSGVSYTQNGVPRTALLRSNSLSSPRCVILAAGALQTPKILMNSGIGPQDVLASAKIPMLLEHPDVGRHLRDHPMIGLKAFVSPILAASYQSAYTLADIWAMYSQDVVRARRQSSETGVDKSNVPSDFGILGTAGFSAGGFLTSPWSHDGLADIQITLYPTVSEPHISSLRSQAGSTGTELLITIALLYPDAEYQIHLNASNPIDGMISLSPTTRNSSKLSVVSSPDDHNLNKYASYLSEMDVDRLAWGVESVRSILGADPLKEFVGEESTPGMNVNGADLSRWIMKNVVSSSNFVGSAGIGPTTNDANYGVVDGRLRVKGVHGLRVSDASVIPRPISGNILATVMAVSSVLADMLDDEISASI